ncbi:MAG TPA: S-layer protein, partial [Gemmataceae bacterium]|nr:S-layer protein [Gemmataceae bacterium]
MLPAIILACFSLGNGLPSTAPAAALKLLPAETKLVGSLDSQRLILLAQMDGRFVSDVTSQGEFTSSNPAVATVDAGGVVRPAADGEALITAGHNGKQATARVKVSRIKEDSPWSFRNHVIPMMTKIGCNSGACHGALAGKGGMKLSLRGYDPDADYFVLTRQALGRRVDTIEPAHSLVLRKPTLAVPHGGGQKLEAGGRDYQVLSEWIAAGATGPLANDTRIQRLEVFPDEAVLKPKDTLQVLVRAWYSDGHAEDVTRWAKFSSTEDLVAGVDADGKVRVAGYGETAITVWFSNLVGTCRIASPLANPLAAKVFADAARRNYVDDLVLKKLAALRIPPSPLCTDEEFIRRAYLDA